MLHVNSIPGLFRKIAWLLFAIAAAIPDNARAQANGPGYALHFNGSNSIVQITGYGASIPTNEITIEFWQRVSATQNQATLAMDPDIVTDRLNISVPWSGNVIYWDFGNINTSGRLAYNPPASILNSWQHFAFVASQSSNFMAVYRNGILEAYQTGMTPFTHRSANLIFGALLNGSNFYSGDLDELRIWNYARTTNQVAQDMFISLVGNEPGLVAYWRLDEGSGTNAFDSTGHGFNGTLINSPMWIASTAPILIPAVTTLPASFVPTNETFFNAAVYPNGSAAVFFEYGLTTNYGSVSSVLLVSASNATPTLTSIFISGLTPGLTYHFRARASNAHGSNVGSDQSFTTPTDGAPTISPVSLVALSTTNFQVQATVNPNGLDTVAWFQYGTTTNYGNLTMVTNISGTNLSAVTINDFINGLLPTTAYYVQLVASNSGGLSLSADNVYTTFGPPIVTTLPATAILPNGATLNGTIDQNGYTSTAWFQYGATTNYGQTTPMISYAGYDTTYLFELSSGVIGLTLGTVYHCQIVGTNQQGTNYGADVTFVPLNTNDALADLSFSGGALTYPFSPFTTMYGGGVGTNISSVTVTAVLEDTNATLQVKVNNGQYQPLVSGVASPPLTVNPGLNPINILVTAQDGVSAQTYTLTIAVAEGNFAVTTINTTGVGSLGNAITLADYAPGPHIIYLPTNAIFSFTAPDNYWYGPNALPPIANDITIEGNGSVLQRATQNRLRFFYVGADPNNAATSNYNSPGSGKLTLRHLTLTNGLAQGGDGGGGGAGMGGAIFNQGILILDSVTLVGNTAQGGNGGGNNSSSGGGMGGNGFGGPVMPAGSQGGPASGASGGGGGGFAVTDDVTNLNGGGQPDGLGGNAVNSVAFGGNGSGAGSPGTQHNNQGGGSGGNFGFTGNAGILPGGYDYASYYDSPGAGGGGVGAGGAGGAPGVESTGEGGSGGFGGGGGGSFQVNEGGGVGGNGGFGGGGGTFSFPNVAGFGLGGFGGGDAGDQYDTGSGGGAGMGGAIFNHNGLLLITNSTLVENFAGGGAGAGGPNTAGGGGSAMAGAIFNLNGIVEIFNTTIFGNTLVPGTGGIYFTYPHVPANGTNGLSFGGAIFSIGYDSATPRAPTLTIVNSILGGSIGGPDCVNYCPPTTSAGTNIASATLIATEPNIIQSFTNSGGIFTNTGVIVTNPLLGPLANNGGPTPTMAPLAGSPALNAGDNAFASATDQRGLPRIWNGTVDLGAVEFQTPLAFNHFSFAAGQFQLNFTGDPQRSYSILTTTNLNAALSNWMYLGPATQLSNGLFQFADLSDSNTLTRYYRVRSP